MRTSSLLKLFGVAILALLLGDGLSSVAQASQPLDTIQLDNGILLRDWIDLPAVQSVQSPLETGERAVEYIKRYGAYRELLDIVSKATRSKAFEERSITAENAAQRLAELDTARKKLGEWPQLIVSHAKAASLSGKPDTALADLKSWLKVAPVDDKRRKEIVALVIESETDGTTVTRYFSAGGRSFTDAATGMEFIFIKGGCYEMGDTFGERWEDARPVHNVCVNDFYLGKYEVTVGLFRAFVQETGYRTEAEKRDGCFESKGSSGGRRFWSSLSFSQDDNEPVVCVSWNDTQAFNTWLSRKGGKGYRLPTEAEWEYAARSGGKNEKYAGASNDAVVDDYAWTDNNSERRTHSVGGKTPNGLGLYDMTGNAFELCQDWYGKYYYSESPKDNPCGPSTGQLRVRRGGAWPYSPWEGYAAKRASQPPELPSDTDGFRLSLSAP